MKLSTKIFGFATFSFLAVAALVGIQPKVAEAVKADEPISYTTHGVTYSLADQIVGLDLSEEGDVTSRWGRQEATMVYKDGVNYCQANQPINTTVSTGSYHTKLDIKMVTPSANYFSMMLRQNSGELTTVTDGDIDIGTRNGFELFTGDNGFQVFHVDNGTRTFVKWFAYDEEGCWAKENRNYVFDIWMLNLADESIQLIIDINGENKTNFNIKAEGTLEGKTLVKSGQIRFGGQFEPADLSSMALEIKGHKFDVGEFNLEDPLEEVDYSQEGAVTSRWGRQHGVVMYENGKVFTGPAQPVNTTISAKSYHTKFDLTLKTPNAYWFNMMLRQNSGELTQAADGKIDIGTKTGFEIFTNNNGFQMFYDENDERSEMIKWFAYDSDEQCWSKAYRTYTFEIWMMNLIDGSIQINIDVNGQNACTFNTAGVAALADKNLVKEGQMRFCGDFVSQTNMAIDIKGYPQKALTKTVYELADTLTEWDISKDNMIVSKWGNQEATVQYVDGVYVAQPGQPINGNVTMGSYHTKFDLNFAGDHPSVGKIWNIMLRQESGTREERDPNIDTGKRTGYELFTYNNGFQFFYNDNNDRTALNPAWVQFDEVDNFNNPERTYTFEIWVLNLKDGTVQINVDVNGELVLRYNSSRDSATVAAPIKTGTVRMCGSFDDLLGKGVKIRGHELNSTSCPFEIEGTIPTEVEVLEDVDLSGAKLVNDYGNFKVSSPLSGKANTRALGETTLELNVPGGQEEIITVVAAPEGTEYSIKEGYKSKYFVGDDFANDLVLIKKKGEESKEFAILASEVSGFDSATNGKKSLAISVAGQSLTASVYVWQYIISDLSQNIYELGEEYKDGQFILNEVCGEQVVNHNILVEDLESWDTSEPGSQTVSFTKFEKTFETGITVVSYAIKEGYKENYFVGQAYAGDVILIVTGDQATEVPVPAEGLVGFDTSSAGTKEVSIVDHDDLTFNITVKVAELVSVAASGAKREFYVGDTFESTGLKVVGVYEDGASKDVTAQATIDSSAVDMTKAGEYAVVVKVGAISTTYNIVVSEVPVVLESISVSGAKAEFYIGDTFATTGLKVTAKYSDGSTADVTELATIDSSAVNMASAGTYNVKVSYLLANASYEVKVSPVPVTVTSISVSGARKDFTKGDTFESTGLKVTATYSDGSTKDVTDKATLDLSGVDMASEGKQTVIVKYEGKSASYEIEVKAKGGCGGTIGAASGLVILAIAGVAFAMAKKRKED